MAGHVRLACLVLAVALAGCTAGGAAGSASPAPGAAGSSSPAATATPVQATTHAPTAMPAPPASQTPQTPTPTPSPAATAGIAPAPVAFEPGQIAIVTATDGVRMRTSPSARAPSQRYAPMLPRGTALYVLSGPKDGSGYHWYEVSPVTFQVTGLVEWPEAIVGPESTGWVAVAGRDGGAWLGHGTAACPPKPTDVMSLRQLSIGARLGCFSQVPISVQARILPCNCSITGPCDAIRPAWFEITGEYLEIAPPATRSGEAGERGGIPLVLDPKGTAPDPPPTDKVVTVTGMFDHPAAAGCEGNIAAGTDGEPIWQPSDSCRQAFVVTSIR